jgi:hypothetical protein
MTKLTHNFGLLAKVESVYGTDPTPVVGTDGVLVVAEPLIQLAYLYDGQRVGKNPGSLGRMKPAGKAGREGTVTLTTEAFGSTSAYSASNVPSIHTLMRGCGMSATVDATGGSESVTYAPVNSAWESLTLWAYARGQLGKLNGAYGNLTITADGPGVPVWEFEYQGMGVVPTDVTLPAITYDNTDVIPPRAQDISLLIGDYASAVVRSFNFQTQVQRGNRVDLNAAAGHGGFALGYREPQLEVVIEADTLTTSTPWHAAATLNPYQLLEAASELATVSLTVGATQYNKYTLTLNDVYAIEGPEEQEDEPNNALWRIVFAPHPSTFTAADDFEIVFD